MERMERNAQKRVPRTVKQFLLAFTLLCLVTAVVACSSHDASKEGDESAPATELHEEEEGGPSAAGLAPSLYLQPGEYPRVDGSTLTIPFSEAVAAAVMDMPIEEARLYVLHNKSHEAYMNLIDGNADIIFATPPSDAELAYAKEQGTELRLVPILNDAFVFFVNAKNPVNGLNRDELVGIYSGNIKNWKELGGDDVDILAYQRPENSGSQTGLLDLLMKDTPLAPAPKEKVYADMGDILDAVAAYENATSAIGYSYYYYTMHMRNDDAIKCLQVDGVAPNAENIANGSYPLISTIYMAFRQDEPASSATLKLAEWILSAEGRAVAEQAGYVPIQ